MNGNNEKEGECCPKFDPGPFQEKGHVWKDRKFIKDSIPQIMHMPIPGLNLFGKAVGRMWKKVEDAGAGTDMEDFLMLAYDPSPWKSELYINTTKEVPDAENVTISGTFLSKVYDGPYKDVPKWFEDMKAYLKEKGKEGKKFYVYYTTCPKCAEKYGHNYVVMFAQVD